LLVIRDLIRKELELDDTVKSAVLGLIDHAHAASAKSLDDTVMRTVYSRFPA
jgi:hypothetical protein